MEVEYDAVERVLQLSRPDLLLLISISPHELVLLAGAKTAEWKQRLAITAGSLLGVPCHWCRGDELNTVLLLVGPDDETWRVALTLPGAVVDRIVTVAEPH